MPRQEIKNVNPQETKNASEENKRPLDAKDFRVLNRATRSIAREYERCVNLLEVSVKTVESLRAENDDLKRDYKNLEFKVTELQKDGSLLGEVGNSFWSAMVHIDSAREISLKFDELVKKYQLEPETTQIADVTEYDTETETMMSGYSNRSQMSALSLPRERRRR